MGCGLAFLLLAQNDPLGSARRLGPAYFPSLLAPLQIGIGAAATRRGAARERGSIGRRGARPYHLDRAHLWSVVSAAGLAIATAVLVLIANAASQRFHAVEALLLLMAPAAFCALVFGLALGLPLPIVGPWLRDCDTDWRRS